MISIDISCIAKTASAIFISKAWHKTGNFTVLTMYLNTVLHQVIDIKMF